MSHGLLVAITIKLLLGVIISASRRLAGPAIAPMRQYPARDYAERCATPDLEGNTTGMEWVAWCSAANACVPMERNTSGGVAASSVMQPRMRFGSPSDEQ